MNKNIRTYEFKYVLVSVRAMLQKCLWREMQKSIKCCVRMLHTLLNIIFNNTSRVIIILLMIPY